MATLVDDSGTTRFEGTITGAVSTGTESLDGVGAAGANATFARVSGSTLANLGTVGALKVLAAGVYALSGYVVPESALVAGQVFRLSVTLNTTDLQIVTGNVTAADTAPAVPFCVVVYLATTDAIHLSVAGTPGNYDHETLLQQVS